MSPSKAQQGSALVMAVFVLTVMLLLGSALVRTLSQESVNVGIEVTRTRALAAAQSGIDWALALTLGRADVSQAGAIAACVSANQMLQPGAALPDSVAFDRCDVTVSCQHRAANASDDAENRFEVKATAECGPEMLRVTRVMEALAYD